MNKARILEEYYSKNYKDLCNQIRRRKLFCSSDHEDVVQEAFTRALQFLPLYNDDRPFDKWFLTILNNCYRDYYRIERNGGVDIEELDEQDHPHYEGIEGIDDPALRKVEELVNEKSEPLRTILNLYYLKGYAPRDISYLVDNIKYSSIRVFISQFKGELSEKLI